MLVFELVLCADLISDFGLIIYSVKIMKFAFLLSVFVLISASHVSAKEPKVCKVNLSITDAPKSTLAHFQGRTKLNVVVKNNTEFLVDSNCDIYPFHY